MDAQTKAPGRPPSPVRLEIRERFARGDRLHYGEYSDLATRHRVSRQRVHELVGQEAFRAGVDEPMRKSVDTRLTRENVIRMRRRLDAVLRIMLRDGTYQAGRDAPALATLFALPLETVTASAERIHKSAAPTPTKLGVYSPARSAGAKIGPVAATYVSQASCPDSEANAIDALPGTSDLRLHIVGDSTTVDGTRLIAAAADRYMARGGKRVWTYTHAWRMVPREAWGRISVFASCESASDLAEARTRGYATALTVTEHPGRRRYEAGPFKILPCPEQTTKGVTCATCRICTDDVRMREEGITISFAVHGSPVSRMRAREALTAARRQQVRTA